MTPPSEETFDIPAICRCSACGALLWGRGPPLGGSGTVGGFDVMSMPCPLLLG